VIPIKQHTIANQKLGFLANYISNPKERRLVLLFFILSAILSIAGIFIILAFYQKIMAVNFRQYKHLFRQFGSISEYGFFAALSIYPIFFILKWKNIKKLKWGKFQIKALLQPLGMLIRKWHVPAALVSTGIVLLHGVLAILKGFKLDFTYLSGISAIIILFFLLFMGLKRYKRNDRKWHFRLAVIFLILFLVHAG
jgi:hypothetical protein